MMNPMRMKKHLPFLVVVILISTTGFTRITSIALSQPSTSLRLAFYYPWFPGHWQENGVSPLSHYHPTLGYYSSTDPATIHRHIDAMQYAKIGAGIASWWGRDNRYNTDAALRRILEVSRGSGFRWAILYELEGPVDNIARDPTMDQIASDLNYLYGTFGNDPSYLRIDGRWVLFVYSDAYDGCDMVSRWNVAKTTHPEAYIVLRVFPSYLGCGLQPDGWYQYSFSLVTGFDNQSPYSYTISPGFWSAIDSHPKLARSLDRWNLTIRGMISSGARFQLVSTFNEWGEGTAVESAAEWATPSGHGAYLDSLHFDAGIIAPSIPGFPFESIIAGLLVGTVLLSILSRRNGEMTGESRYVFDN